MGFWESIVIAFIDNFSAVSLNLIELFIGTYIRLFVNVIMKYLSLKVLENVFKLISVVEFSHSIDV